MKSKHLTSSSSFESISTTFSSTLPKYPSFRSPRSFLSEDSKGSGHFLDFCHLCKCYIGSRHDIFMYMGDIPFCSEECRQEQIDLDEAKEKKAKIMQNQQQLSNNSSPEKIYVRITDAVAAS